MQSLGAAKAVSLAVGHNPGRVATPTQDTSQHAGTHFAYLGRMTGRVNPTAERDLNSGPYDPKPTTLTIKQTPGIQGTGEI